MKKSLIFKKIIYIVLAILLISTVNVYAADSFKTKLSVDSSSKKLEDEVVVTISLSNIAIESGEKGIGAYTAKVDFDSSVFEFVETSGTKNWEAPMYEDGLIVGITAQGNVAKEDQEIGSITFKVKKDAKLGETTIKLTNFSGSSVASDIDAKDSSVKINITTKNGSNNNNSEDNNDNKDSNNANQSNQNNNDSNNKDNQNNNSSKDSGSESKKDSNQNNNQINFYSKSKTDDDKSESKLPFTGTSGIIIYIVIAIAVLILIRMLIIRKIYNKQKKESSIVEKEDK